MKSEVSREASGSKVLRYNSSLNMLLLLNLWTAVDHDLVVGSW